MGYVKLKIKGLGAEGDLKRWEDHMLEKPKCWNKFCFGCYEKKDLHAVKVGKTDNEEQLYITTLCDDCIHSDESHDILVNENHLMVETNTKL